MIGELDQRLRRRLCRRGAYFFADLANTTETDELHAINSGAIQAIANPRRAESTFARSTGR